jgi:hypothetical protein
MKIREIEVMDQDIDDIMVSALEGGITYWCDKAVVEGDYLGTFASDQISRGGVLKLHGGEEDEWYVLTKEKFMKGLKQLLDTDYGKTAVDEDDNGKYLDPGNVDGPMADTIIQYALFGECVYA